MNTYAPNKQQERLSEYIKKCRGVTPDNPDGVFSQRAFAKMIGINVSTINSYENRKDVKVSRIDTENLQKLAEYPAPWKGRKWSVAELTAYLNGEEFSDVNIYKILGTIRNEDSLENLLLLQKEAINRMGTLISGQKNGAVPEFPKFNTQVLTFLDERRKLLSMEEDEFYQYCDRRGLNRDLYESIRKGDRVDIPTLGFIARVLDVSVDSLIKLQQSTED